MLWPDPSSLSNVSDHQRSQYTALARGNLGILTGGPGTGKTTTAAAIMRRCAAKWGQSAIAAAAPTGKAAIRLTESLADHGVELEATTIHRMLGVTRSGRDGEGWSFQYDEHEQLPRKMVAIDEVSMLGVDLCASLFRALSPDTVVLLVGDLGQLPPVEHGAPLRDFIAAGVPNGQLSEIWRNSGDIVKACHKIREGGRYTPSRTVNLEEGNNLRHIETRSAAAILAKLRGLYRSLPKSIDVSDDVQVLCSLRESGDLSAKSVNDVLRVLINPAGERPKGCKFAMGDKVMCTENSLLEVAGGNGAKDFVANGEIGKVAKVAPGKIWVSFNAPERTVIVPGGFQEVFQLGYAITCHKSQGSQWPYVIYLIDESGGARWINSRELIYTALSRAQKLAVTIGPRAAIDQDCRKVAISQRKTALAGLIQEKLAR